MNASKQIRLTTPFEPGILESLKAGDEVLLSGEIFTARDQAHKKLLGLLKEKAKLPLNLENKVIYYCGPTRRRPEEVIGSCGPTTSSRMDTMTPPLLKLGLKGMIGKGRRSEAVRQAIQKHKGVYFLATGGAGALLSKKVKSLRKVCFTELGPEAVCRLTVKDFPLIVGIDARGRDIFQRKGQK
ncbi:MAG: FumA C-terminus/TtdB family hydratase beta subunit [Candidatus Omnitrophota bacterium]